LALVSQSASEEAEQTVATLHFELVSPEKLLFSGEVEQVDIPGAEGDFGVLADHAPTVATVRPGILTVHAGGSQQKIVVLGGFAEVSSKGLTVLADIAEAAEDIDRAMIATRIAELESRITKTEPGSEFDKLARRLDHFKEVDRHLAGGGAI
jgi:F-type H+-transporting ATPase subunit epsilon